MLAALANALKPAAAAAGEHWPLAMSGVCGVVAAATVNAPVVDDAE